MKETNRRQVLLWALYLVVLYIMYRFAVGVKAPLKHATVFMAMQLSAFYVNVRELLPKFYIKKKYWRFGIFNALVLVTGAMVIVLSEGGIVTVEGHTIKNAHYTIETLMANSVPLLIGIFVAFVFHSHQQQLQHEQREKERFAAEKNFLVQQINPHFIFNTLNNIYSFIIDNSPKSSEALLQLSKMLDYSLYGSKKEFVRLTDEVLYIKSFIGLFKLKDDEITNITFKHSINHRAQVAPMLLLPFVENAFKHGNIEDVNKGCVKINIETQDGMIRFECFNSYTEEKMVDSTGGIGISNVRRRLELIYPQRHKLKIDINNGSYRVYLEIESHDI